MHRKLLSIVVIVLMACPTLSLAQGRHGAGQAQRQDSQMNSRQHTPIQQQQRDRKRDGTGANCTGGCLQKQSRQQTKQKTQIREQAEIQQETQTQKK